VKTIYHYFAVVSVCTALVFIVLPTFLLIFLVVYILYIVFKKIGSLQCIKGKCQCPLNMVFRKKHSQGEASNGHGGLDTDSLPHRLVNPEEYKPLIAAVNQQVAGNFEIAAEARVSPINSYGMALLVIDTAIKYVLQVEVILNHIRFYTQHANRK